MTSVRDIKLRGKSYTKILLKSALRICQPWAVIHVDCCTPLTVKYWHEVTQQVIKQKIQLLTICDTCTSWPEFAILLNMTANHVAWQLDRAWFCHYPQPEMVICDNGTEFIGRNFQELLERYGVKGQPTTVKNPQADLLVECLHGQLGDHLRRMVFEGSNFYDDLDTMVQAAAYVIRATVPSDSPYSPLQLAFGHDIANKCSLIGTTSNKIRQAKANKNNTKKNKTRQEHIYYLGNLVLLLNPTYEWHTKRKLHPPTEGPYPITEITNGTVSIRRGHVDEIVSIQRIWPYHVWV